MSWKKEFICGLDLGQAFDYSALALVEKVRAPLPEYDGNTLRPKIRTEYHLIFLERMLGVPYPQQVAYVKQRLAHPELRIHSPSLVVDVTGGGKPISDLFTAAGVLHWGVHIHGGSRVSREGMVYHTPKRDLVSVVQVLLQQRALKIAEALPERATLTAELQNFRVKIDLKTAYDSYEAWRERDHDDLVLAVALACWYGEHGGMPAQLSEVEGL